MAAAADVAKVIAYSAASAGSGWGVVRYLRKRWQARGQLNASRIKSFATIDRLAAEIIPENGQPLRQVISRTNSNVLEMRETLHHMQHQNRISSEMMGFGFMRADSDGDVTDVDRVILHITGRAPEELIGRNWYSTIVQEDRVRVIDAITNSVRNRTEVRLEFSFECLRRVQTKVRMFSRPRYDSGGNLIEFTMGVQVV